MSAQNNQSGNVLFLVLIGIAMFAALSYTVANMMNSGDATYVTEEKANLYAGEILDYARKVRETVQYLKISNDCDDTEISFENNVVSGYTNANAPSDKSCHVFDSDGGGLQYLTPDEKWLDTALSAEDLYGVTHFPEGNCVKGVASEDTGADQVHGFCDASTDYVDMLHSVLYLNKQVCEAINRQLHGSSNVFFDRNHSIGEKKWDGAINTLGLEIADTAGEIEGQMAMCIQSGTPNFFPEPNSYHFYQVLIPR